MGFLIYAYGASLLFWCAVALAWLLVPRCVAAFLLSPTPEVAWITGMVGLAFDVWYWCAVASGDERSNRV